MILGNALYVLSCDSYFPDCTWYDGKLICAGTSLAVSDFSISNKLITLVVVPPEAKAIMKEVQVRWYVQDHVWSW